MNTTESQVRQERKNAKFAAFGVVGFSLIAVPAVLAEGMSTGRFVSLAPSLAVAAVWVAISLQIVIVARRWAQLPDDESGLRAGLAARARIDPRGVLAGLCAFFLGWAPWKLYTDWAMYVAEPWRGVVGFGGFFVLAAGLWWVFGREQRRLAERAASLG